MRRVILCVQAGAAAGPYQGGPDGRAVSHDRPHRQGHAGVRRNRQFLGGGLLVEPALLLEAHPHSRAQASQV